MNQLLEFVKYTTTPEPQIRVLENHGYFYAGCVREDLSDDILDQVIQRIDGDSTEIQHTRQRIQDFMRVILGYEVAPYVHLELDLHMNSEERAHMLNTPCCWHRECLDDDPIFGGAKFTVAITGERTLFIRSNEYNSSVMDRLESGEEIDLHDAFKDEVVISSFSDEMSIFGGYINPVIHSAPYNNSNRIFINAVFGSHDEMYRDACCAGEENNWSKLSSERS